MTKEQIILHLSLIDGIGPSVLEQMLAQEEVPFNDFYNFSLSDFVTFFKFSRETGKKIVEGLQKKELLEHELRLIEKNNIQWTTFISDDYPPLLKTIHLPPAVLYWQGAHPYYERAVAFVGSRAANQYGIKVVQLLIPELVMANCAIISGGALGIDAFSHQAALDAGGKTVAVLGSGLLQPQIASNRKLFEDIIYQGGSIVTTFPLNEPGYPGNFPARNRIVSGLSHGTVVVQAAKKSGALITANYALEQGKEVFAVPGPIDDQLSVGCHNLIQQGAKLVSTAADILTEFGWLSYSEQLFDAAAQMSVLPLTAIKKKKPEVIVDSVQAKVVILCMQPTSIDDIVKQLEMNLFAVQTLLFDMQLEGLIEQDFAGLWRAKS